MIINLALIIIIIILFFCVQTQEGFYAIGSGQCGGFGRALCNQEPGCVYAYAQDGTSKCVAGDKYQGPYFMQDYIAWDNQYPPEYPYYYPYPRYYRRYNEYPHYLYARR